WVSDRAVWPVAHPLPAALHESGIGARRTPSSPSKMSASAGLADPLCSRRAFPLLTNIRRRSLPRSCTRFRGDVRRLDQRLPFFEFQLDEGRGIGRRAAVCFNRLPAIKPLVLALCSD